MIWTLSHNTLNNLENAVLVSMFTLEIDLAFIAIIESNASSRRNGFLRAEVDLIVFLERKELSLVVDKISIWWLV